MQNNLPLIRCHGNAQLPKCIYVRMCVYIFILFVRNILIYRLDDQTRSQMQTHLINTQIEVSIYNNSNFYRKKRIIIKSTVQIIQHLFN